MNITKLGIGSVQFGLDYGISNNSGQTSLVEAQQILEIALNHGLTYLDTASTYGNAEVVIGKIASNDFNIISKFTSLGNVGILQKELESTLFNLRRDYIYAYLAHKPEEILQNKSIWKELLSFRESGKIRKIGFSIKDVGIYEQLVSKGFTPDLVQIPYNLLDNTYENVAKDVKSRGGEVHSRSVFLQGLFFRNISELPSHFNSVKNILQQIKDESESSLSGNLLRFAVEKDFIDCVILGVNNTTQLIENILSLKKSALIKRPNINISDNILNPALWKLK